MKHYDVSICRLMSKLADVRSQSSHGTFHFMMSYITFSACFVLGYYMYFTLFIYLLLAVILKINCLFI